jgi:hypothetical protein
MVRVKVYGRSHRVKKSHSDDWEWLIIMGTPQQEGSHSLFSFIHPCAHNLLFKICKLTCSHRKFFHPCQTFTFFFIHTPTPNILLQDRCHFTSHHQQQPFPSYKLLSHLFSWWIDIGSWWRKNQRFCLDGPKSQDSYNVKNQRTSRWTGSKRSEC